MESRGDGDLEREGDLRGVAVDGKGSGFRHETGRLLKMHSGVKELEDRACLPEMRCLR